MTKTLDLTDLFRASAAAARVVELLRAAGATPSSVRVEADALDKPSVTVFGAYNLGDYLATKRVWRRLGVTRTKWYGDVTRQRNVTAVLDGVEIVWIESRSMFDTAKAVRAVGKVSA